MLPYDIGYGFHCYLLHLANSCFRTSLKVPCDSDLQDLAE